MNYQIHCGDNVEYLKTLSADSIDSCITDPPYGMSIAGVDWDHSVPPVETWKEVYRVLKPGAFVLSFCNPEFYHRMAVNVDDAGFRPLDLIWAIISTPSSPGSRGTAISKSSAGKMFQSGGNSMFSRVEPFGSNI